MTDPHYLRAYHTAVSRHGASSFRSLLWAARSMQRARFQVFVELYDFEARTVLDVGCGHGHLLDHLERAGMQPKRYIGLDALGETIDAGRARRPGLDLHHVDVLSTPEALSQWQPNVVCLCGTLNTMTDGEALRLLKHCWDTTTDALLFNFLSDRCDPRAPRQDTGPARRLPTLQLMDWALTQTPHVVLRQDYFRGGHDATVLMRREGPVIVLRK